MRHSALLGVLACAITACSGCPSPPDPLGSPAPDVVIVPALAPPSLAPRLSEGFTKPLDPKLWTQWTHNLAALKSSAQTSSSGLNIELETYGRAAEEVSVVAIAWNPVQDFLGEVVRLEFELDWLEDSNASYLSAGLALVPETAPLSGDPRDHAEVTHLSFIGAGMGANVRRELLVQRKGQEVFRDSEGWPETGRDGRTLKTVRLSLTLTGSMMKIEEAGRPPVSVPVGLGFARGRVVLYVASHSNSMRRAMRFTHLELRVLEAIPAASETSADGL
jgi:hypothetical protein